MPEVTPPLIVCVKVGSFYGPEYANRLAAGVARHTTAPHEFLCLTDDARSVECPTAPVETDLERWWAKLVLFKPHSALAGRRVLYLDLDTVVVGALDPLLAYDGPLCVLDEFWPDTDAATERVILDRWLTPDGTVRTLRTVISRGGRHYNSSVMSIAPGAARHVWTEFAPALMRRYHGDQEWLTDQVPDADRWAAVAPGVIASYKIHRLAEGPGTYRVICFHGRPKPAEVGGWVAAAWRGGA